MAESGRTPECLAPCGRRSTIDAVLRHQCLLRCRTTSHPRLVAIYDYVQRRPVPKDECFGRKTAHRINPYGPFRKTTVESRKMFCIMDSLFVSAKRPCS